MTKEELLQGTRRNTARMLRDHFTYIQKHIAELVDDLEADEDSPDYPDENIADRILDIETSAKNAHNTVERYLFLQSAMGRLK